MVATLSLTVAAFAGCAEPQFDRCTVTCMSSTDCPSGLTCNFGDGYCHAAADDMVCSGDPGPMLPRDAGPDASEPKPDGGDDLPVPPDASPQAVAITITQSEDPDSIVRLNSVVCNENLGGDGINHKDNHYIRVFTLGNFGITSDFTIESIAFGIETADSPSGTQPIELRFSTLSGSLSFDNMTRIGTYSVAVENAELVVKSTSLDPPLEVPAGEELVVEVFTPDGTAQDNLFIIGSNAAGQLAPSYIAAPDCTFPEPTPSADIGFPGMHVVMSLTGNYIP